MTLVPILSTIILFFTIATFILAVAAYILYKVRERNASAAREEQQQQMPEPHVLMTPQPMTTLGAAPAPASTNVFIAPSEAPAQADFAPQEPQQLAAPTEAASSVFWEYTDEGFVPVHPEQEADAEGKADEEEGFAWL